MSERSQRTWAGAARPGRILLVMQPGLDVALANGLRERLGCDVTVAHHLRTAWSLTTAHGHDSAAREAGVRRWAAVVAQVDLEDGPGLALLSHVRSLAPEVPALLLEVTPTPGAGAGEAFTSGRVRYTTPRDTARALIAAMGRPLETLEPSGIGPAPAPLEPLLEAPGPAAFGHGSDAPAPPPRRPGPSRWG